MKDILEEIVEHKSQAIARLKSMTAIADLERRAFETLREAVSMRRSLENSATGIIAEFKRRSPSKGWINESARAKVVPAAYQANGAAALSILTDEEFFGGSLEFLQTARRLVRLPLLRKDFIIDEYQLFEARIAGADAVLLIAACLDKGQCRHLSSVAHELGLEVLLEVHSESETEYIDDAVDMVGVNNRNLGTFRTDVQNSFRMAGSLPDDRLWVSESGISSPETIERLREVGYRGFLMGERFMQSSDPGAALGTFIASLK